MIENIRKYQGLILFFIAIVIISLVVGIKDDLFRGGAGGQAVYRINGRTYSDKEFQKLGAGAFELAGGLARAGDFSLYQFLIELSQGATSQDDATEKFFVGRMILREAKNELGVHPGETEITEYIRNLAAFSDKDKAFNQETYNNFIQKVIGRLGMTENDLRELASDAIAASRINRIIGSGLATNRDAVATKNALEKQQISGSLAWIDIAPLEAGIKPTEEEIKSYWEPIQDAFMTNEKRKFTYIIASPKPSAPKEADKLADQMLKDEEKAKKQQERETAAKEEARKNQIELDGLVDEFSFLLEEQKGSGFEELAAKNQWTVSSTDMISKDKSPAELNVKLRSSSMGGNAIDELFQIEATTDPLSRISQPIAIGENQWLIARLDADEKPRAKTFEEAREEALSRLVSEKAFEALKKSAQDTKEKISTAIAGGKSFADAAKEAGIADANLKAFSKVNATPRPTETNEPKQLFQKISNVDPGKIADIITEEKRAFIVLVSSREVEKDPKVGDVLKTRAESSASENESLAYTDWLKERTAAAKVESLIKR
ncbi:MAG: SurA N-terminal domain-containing protein [Luteolibacter sp.]